MVGIRNIFAKNLDFRSGKFYAALKLMLLIQSPEYLSLQSYLSSR